MGKHSNKNKKLNGKQPSPQKRDKGIDNNDDDLLLSSIDNPSGSVTLKTVVAITAIAAVIISLVVGYFLTETTTLPPGGMKSTSKQRKLSIDEIITRAKTLPCKDRYDTGACAQMSANGDCDVSPGWMTVMCAASCGRCELLDPKLRCSEENMKIKFEDAYKPGDLNNMFRSLINRSDVETEVLRTSPYMVLVKNFISEEESSTLLRLTEKKLKRSTDQGEIAEDGFQEQVISEYRTSSNAWCDHICERHPVVANLMERIAELVSIPTKNFESFQVLRYEKTQKYDVHHDGKYICQLHILEEKPH
jgi:hypothetical protein